MGEGVLGCGWYDAGQEWRPIKVSATGAQYIVETVDALNDIGDVNVPAPADNEALIWDNVAGEWVAEAPVPAAHKDSHDPEDGSDPLDCAAPGSISEAADAEGSAHSFARSDHNHQHLAALHENGGGAEISVAGLSGELADDQPPKAHKDSHDPEDGSDPLDCAAAGSISEAADAEGSAHSFARSDHNHQHLAALHENGGGAEISVAGLSGELADDQPPKAHEASHQSGGADILYVPRTYVWFVPGDVATGTEQGPTFRMKRATIIEDVELHVKTAPTGAALIVDINEDGTTVFTTKPEIDIAGTTEDDNHIFSDTALAAAAELTMDIDQVGSTVTGADLTVLLHCKEPVI